MDWTDDDAEEDEERGCRLVPRPERVFFFHSCAHILQYNCGPWLLLDLCGAKSGTFSNEKSILLPLTAPRGAIVRVDSS